jgi:two-component system phosphate regulon sensor histidine kinase PhoR
MNETRYKWILYVIVAVIAGTISIQVYWNYKNYEVNKQQLINDVQLSLDQAIEKYFAQLAEERTVGFAFESTQHDSVFSNYNMFDSLIGVLDFSTKKVTDFDSLDITLNADNIIVYKGVHADSLLTSIKADHFPRIGKSKLSRSDKKRIELNHIAYQPDSTVARHLERLTSKVVISLTNDNLELEKVDSLFGLEVNNKNLDITHDLKVVDTFKDSLSLENVPKKSLLITSKSPFLTSHNQVIAVFSNSTLEILKRGISGILISTLLVLVVIGCLFYLLNIIKHQKQLAEVKNDLISNITHEFKTPIATIGVALESIKDFNVINNKEKTSSYLDMSKTQLDKLNVMVEKLLETATLDSEELNLNKENINIVDLVETLVKKYSLSTTKNLLFESTNDEIYGTVDIFHFENALNNVIDNAVKYGGEEINVKINQRANNFNLEISDNGNNLSPIHKQRIFEKFYRIPKGNTHDVKGFGIGLYYTKKIIEKHKGSVLLDLSNNLTTFKISIPNE